MPKFNPRALLRQYANILDELKRHEIIRTFNNPVSDYAEWLAAEKLDFKLAHNSKDGYDATDSDGERVQIKSRRLEPSNKARVLGVIRNLDSNKFDYLIAILFDMKFNVTEVYKIPRKVIGKYANFSKHQNGHIINLKGNIVADPAVNNITKMFTSTAR